MGDGFSKDFTHDFTVQGETAQALTAPGRRATPGVTAIESTSSAHLSGRALLSLSPQTNKGQSNIPLTMLCFERPAALHHLPASQVTTT